MCGKSTFAKFMKEHIVSEKNEDQVVILSTDTILDVMRKHIKDPLLMSPPYQCG